MKITSSAYIRGVKDRMKQVREALKRIEEAEKAQDAARNCRDYNRYKDESAEATSDAMHALEEAVRLVSAIGCANNLYDIHTYHKVVKYDIRDTFE